MDFRIEESSDSSSEEEEQPKESIDSAKRSYECSFCRRGFTNAQALGGHMNIHRKDRAKAKQISLSSSVQMNQNDYQSDPPKSSSYPFFETQSDYQLYFQPPPAIPQHADFHDSSHWYVRNSQPSGSTQELLGTNLSLRIGPRISEAEVGSRSIWKNDEVDLELRLGHDP